MPPQRTGVKFQKTGQGDSVEYLSQDPCKFPAINSTSCNAKMTEGWREVKRQGNRV